MQRTLNDILLDILTISNYPHDKQQFLVDFTKMNHLEAIANIIDRQPEAIQEKIRNAPESEKENEIRNYIDEEEYILEMTKVSYEALKQFISAVSPKLGMTQKEKITNLLSH